MSRKRKPTSKAKSYNSYMCHYSEIFLEKVAIGAFVHGYPLPVDTDLSTVTYYILYESWNTKLQE